MTIRRARRSAAREGLLVDLGQVFQNLARGLFDSYRPELHYMRGPGPKWHAKHARPASDAFETMPAFEARRA